MFHKISRPFNTTYKCFSVSMLPGNERQDVERGGKIIMPPSALDTLTRLNIEYPMIFKLTNRKTKRVTHCGVLEFVADEGKVYLPHWMMSNLILKEGASIHIESVSLPVATFSKFQPLSEDFLDISNAKAVLENCLRNFSCLTTGDVIAIKYNSKVYELCVLETKPGNAVIIIECDMNMNSDDVKYYVAELLEGSLKSSDKYVCIPFSWMKHRKTTDGEVLIKYPIETKSVTKRRVQNREESSHDWPIFSAELKLGTNSYKEATDYIKILNKISEQEESEIDESVPSTSGLTSETISNQTSDQESTASIESQKEINVGDSSQNVKRYFTRLRSRISSPANTVNVDQTVENDSPETSSCSEEIVQYNQDENSSEQNCEKFTKGFILREALREVLGDNCKEIVDMLYAKYCERYRSFQKLCHDALQRCKTFEEMKKIFDDDNYGQGVSPSKRKKVTWSEVQNNNDDTDETDEDDNIENDNDNPSDKIRGQARKFTLSPEYDPEDPEWMLKHREYKKGLVELIPNSHIYVDAVKLNDCKNVARDSVPSTSGLTSETISNQTSDQESTASKESQKEINVGDSSQIFKRYFTRLRSRISSPANTVNVDQTVENDSPDTSSCSEEIVQYHQDENSSEQNCEKFTKGFILREALREVLGDNCEEIVDMLYAEYCERYRSFQKLCHDALQRCKTFEEMKKIFDDDNYGQGVSPSKRKKVTWSEVQNNNDDTDVTDEDDNIENDNDNPSDKIRGQARKFTLPPEYDPEDSKWMLKHREYKEGLVELIPNSHIYVDAVKLNYCKNVARDSKSLARMLLVEVFRESALSICSPTGKKANAFTGTDIRPGLDEHARKVLLKFVDQHTIAKKWVRRDNATILNTLRNKMQELRGKYR